MNRASASVAIAAAIAILTSPVLSFAQSTSGPSGSGAATGSPNAGSAGAGTSGIGGVPSAPASPGAGADPSGAGNSAQRASPPPPGTNSAGTAQSSGGRGVTTGSAGAGTWPQTSEDAAINEENKTIDRKLKGICRGC